MSTDHQPGPSPEICPSLRGTSSHVRFTSDEHRRISDEATLRGTTIPRLLKHCYFKGCPVAPIIAHEEARTIMAELRRIGTNINQIARQLNAQGIADDLQRAIAEAVEYLRSLRLTLGGLDGAR